MHAEGIDALSRQHKEQDEPEVEVRGSRAGEEGDGTYRETDGGEGAAEGAEQLPNQTLRAVADAADGQKIQGQARGEEIVEAARGDESAGDHENDARGQIHEFPREKRNTVWRRVP